MHSHFVIMGSVEIPKVVVWGNAKQKGRNLLWILAKYDLF